MKILPTQVGCVDFELDFGRWVVFLLFDVMALGVSSCKVMNPQKIPLDIILDGGLRLISFRGSGESPERGSLISSGTDKQLLNSCLVSSNSCLSPVSGRTPGESVFYSPENKSPDWGPNAGQTRTASQFSQLAIQVLASLGLLNITTHPLLLGSKIILLFMPLSSFLYFQRFMLEDVFEYI